jgi:hypothetical protein
LKPHTADTADVSLRKAKLSPAFADDVPEGAKKGIVNDFRHVPTSLPRVLGTFSQRSLVSRERD